jgi:hypothetical protein
METPPCSSARRMGWCPDGEAPDARAARPDARTREPACPRYEPTYTNV